MKRMILMLSVTVLTFCVFAEEAAPYIDYYERYNAWGSLEQWSLITDNRQEVVVKIIVTKQDDGSGELSLTIADPNYAYLCPFVSGSKFTVPNSHRGYRLKSIQHFSALLAELHVPSSSSEVDIHEVFQNCPWQKVRYEGPSFSEHCLKYCKTLQEISLPNIEVIEREQFYGCTNLHKVTLSHKLKSIGYLAFAGCPIDSIYLNQGLEYIGGEPFVETNIKSLTIPSTVTNIAGCLCFGMKNIKYLYVDSGNPNYASDDCILYNKSKTDLFCAQACRRTTITLPSGVTNLCSSAFAGMGSLYCVNIPPTVKRINDGVFARCPNLRYVILPWLDYIGGSVFEDCSKLSGIEFRNLPPVSNSGYQVYSTGYVCSLQGMGCNAQGLYALKWEKQWKAVIKDGLYGYLPMKPILDNSFYYYTDPSAVNYKVTTWTNEKLEKYGVPSDKPISYGDKTTSQTLDAARLFGVEPVITESEDEAEISAELSFRIVGFERREDELVLEAEVSVERGSLPESYKLTGTPLVSGTTELNSEWSNILPSVSTQRLSDRESRVTLLFPVGENRFFKINMVDTEEVVSLL